MCCVSGLARGTGGLIAHAPKARGVRGDRPCADATSIHHPTHLLRHLTEALRCAPVHGCRCLTMLSKKSSILISSYTNLSPLYYTHVPGCCPPQPRKSCRHTFPRLEPARQRRSYAQHQHVPAYPDDVELLNGQTPRNHTKHPRPTRFSNAERAMHTPSTASMPSSSSTTPTAAMPRPL
jgi:hypothetical protein